MSKYYSIHEFSKIIGVSAQTLRNWDANGKLHPHHTTVSGYRYYSDEQLNQVINVKPKNRITIGYCRVSSHKQKDDLERQIDNVKTYLLAKGQPFEIISDIGSGINYKKKGLQELIRRILNCSPSSRQLKKYKFFLPAEIYLLAVFMQLASKFHVFPLVLKFQDSFANVCCCSNLYNLRSFLREYFYQ